MGDVVWLKPYDIPCFRGCKLDICTITIPTDPNHVLHFLAFVDLHAK